MRTIALAFVVAAVAIACGSHPRNTLIVQFDAGADDAGDSGALDAGPDADPALGGPCVDDAQCDDRIACTYDACDKTLRRCRNIPDDTQCDDGVYCDGKERCVPKHGCEPGPVVTCSDGNACDLARCVEATKSCAHTPRDADQDGDPDAHCAPHHDCNDLDPTVSSQHAEVCANGKDDNCNGLVDEQPCAVPQGDTCASAVAIGGAGTYSLSTLGDNYTYATSCSVTHPNAGRQVVAAITVPSGPKVDLETWATTSSGGVEVAVAIQAACGQSSTEIACGSGAGAWSVRARARSVGPGTYYAIVTTQSETNVELRVEMLAPAPKATNEDCSTAAPIGFDTPTTVQIVDPSKDLASACAASTGELTYAFTLAQPQDVRVYASTLQGSGSPVVGLRAPHCTDASDELRCRAGTAVPLYARGVQPGTYVLTVAATSPIDASLDVHLDPPTAPPADQTCASPPSIAANQTIAVDLSNHEDAIQDGCFPGNPDAAYDLSLSVASDVMVVGRFAQTDPGAVALDAPACGVSSRLACGVGPTPVRIDKRSVPAGDYRVVVTDVYAMQAMLTALVRPTVAPTIIPAASADTCAKAVDASQGGFFTSDTTGAGTNYDHPCDAPNVSPAPGQVLGLNLTQPQRVVLDMDGSTYTTILDVRQGPSCPGTPLKDACYVGFYGPRSFLDVELAAGQYWILVSGYQQQKGSWDMDVRVLPP